MRVLAAIIAALCVLNSTNQLGVKAVLKAILRATGIWSSKPLMVACSTTEHKARSHHTSHLVVPLVVALKGCAQQIWQCWTSSLQEPLMLTKQSPGHIQSPYLDLRNDCDSAALREAAAADARVIRAVRAAAAAHGLRTAAKQPPTRAP